MLDEDSCKSPDEREYIGDVSCQDGSGNAYEGSDDDQRTCPYWLAEAPSTPIHSDQKGCDVGNGGYGYPSEIDGEGQFDEEPLLECHRFVSQHKVDGYQGEEDEKHQDN